MFRPPLLARSLRPHLSATSCRPLHLASVSTSSYRRQHSATSTSTLSNRRHHPFHHSQFQSLLPYARFLTTTSTPSIPTSTKDKTTEPLTALTPTVTQPLSQPPSTTTTSSSFSSSSDPIAPISYEPPPSILDRIIPSPLRGIKPYLELTRLDKPIGSALLFWPCAWSITLSTLTLPILPSPTLPLYYLTLFGTGAIIMRGAGCTINDMWDFRLDRAVDRTKSRPLARGAVTPFQALIFLGGQLTIGLAVLLQLNWYSILLGASSLGLVVIYPFMKRITYYPQIVLGLAFNWGAFLGWSAVVGHVDWAIATPLYLGGVAWCVFYDTIYAHQDKKDDILVNIKSTALRFGTSTRPILSLLSLTFLSSLTYVGHALALSPLYYTVSVLGAGVHLAWQLWKVDFERRENCWRFFVSNGWLGGLVWAGMWGEYLGRWLEWL